MTESWSCVTCDEILSEHWRFTSRSLLTQLGLDEIVEDNAVSPHNNNVIRQSHHDNNVHIVDGLQTTTHYNSTPTEDKRNQSEFWFLIRWSANKFQDIFTDGIDEHRWWNRLGNWTDYRHDHRTHQTSTSFRLCGPGWFGGWGGVMEVDWWTGGGAQVPQA